MLWQDTLYVSVTASQLADGSKRAFVSLLELENRSGCGDLDQSEVITLVT